jgi:ATP-dependent DNA helicase RecQ
MDDVPAELLELGAAADYQVGDTGLLRARPYAPNWLAGDIIDPVRGIDGAPEARLRNEEVSGEAYLQSLTFEKWNSPAQKEAVWLALTAPPRSTTLVALPTGAGKSLCFQMLARFSGGLTLVVVPTVALAIDHWRSAQQVMANVPGLNPTYYAAGDPEVSTEKVIELVRQGETRLLFTSPEACVSGRLRDALQAAAKRGWLDTLVIDEAHLVDTWGMEFRADFQVLSALRRQWLAAADSRVRTLLLSATFTPDCRELLRVLFSDADASWREAVTQRLRPEMTYYVRQFLDQTARDDALLESVWRLPRPAVLYTTEVADAKRISEMLWDRGFRRVGCFHGATRSDRRRTLLDQWRGNDLDVMVATSAFGMGVDKADVRTVIHACFPENLHRYYQEVGRGGRDGFSTICLLLPTRRDERVGSGLAPSLMTPEKIQGRWESLWTTRRREAAEHVWSLRLDAKPSWLEGTITGQRHVAWNKRLLLQLLRARLLELHDVRLGREVGPEALPASGEIGGSRCAEWATVRVNFPPTSAGVGDLVETVRKEELTTTFAGLRYLREYVAGASCISRPLRQLYGRDVVRACGGCPADRREGRLPLACPTLPIGTSPRTAPARVVIAGAPSPRELQGEAKFVALVRRLLRQAGIRRFACGPALHGRILELFGRAIRSDDPRTFYRVDSNTPDSPLEVGSDERLVVFHVGAVDRTALALAVGAEVVHLFSSDVPLLDAHGRRPLEGEGVPYYLTPEDWLRECGNVH